MKFINNPVFRFLTKALVLYIFWYLVYELWLGPNGKMDLWLILKTNILIVDFLSVFGYEIETTGRLLSTPSGSGVWIGDPCNGIPLFALFTGFILAMPGAIKKKMIFIPVGIISIHLINIIRILILLFIQDYFPQYLEFNHTYTFTALVYGYIFVLWMIWVNIIIKREKTINEKPQSE